MLDTYGGRRMFFNKPKIKKEAPKTQILFSPPKKVAPKQPKEVELKEFQSGRMVTLGNF